MSALLSASSLLVLLLLAMQDGPVGSAASSQVCNLGAPLASSPPRGCGGAELLKDPSFSGSSTGWSIYRWAADGATVSFVGPGAQAQVQAHTQAHKYDALFYQKVDFDIPMSGGSYSLCIRGGSSTAGNVLRFAVDGDAPLQYQVPGQKPRALLPLPIEDTASGCFDFELPGGPYAGRVTIEFGDTSGDVAVCEATLLRCGLATKMSRSRPVDHLPVSSEALIASQPDIVWKSPACPVPAQTLKSFSCSGDALSEELLGSAAFSGADGQGPWTTFAWQADAATFSFGPKGLRLAVDALSPASQLYDVTLNQEIVLHPSDGPPRHYELCVQAGAQQAGAQLRFAVDSGAPFFAVPGMQERFIMDLKAVISIRCFRFALDPTVANYSGRVALEMGASTGQISLCQVSLRSCREKTYIEGALDAVRRCYIAPLQAAAGGCTRNAAMDGTEFGLNSLGQETDGKQACLQRLRRLGADTFSFLPGRCELWTCSTRAALLASASGEGDGQVYSQYCEYQDVAD